jgi:DNA-binding CsgD family transcriptional regulator
VRYVPDLRGMPRALTHREQEILQLAANGHPNREIAEELGLSPLTIKSHLGRIGRKLGSGDRAQLVLLALRAGAIS